MSLGSPGSLHNSPGLNANLKAEEPGNDNGPVALSPGLLDETVLDHHITSEFNNIEHLELPESRLSEASIPLQETETPKKSNSNNPPPVLENMSAPVSNDGNSRVSAYARLDFDSFTFYVQTLQVVLGRKPEHGGSADVDVHLGAAKAISRRHAKIFYNFATQRFELTVIGRNGAFVGDIFVETGSTVPLRDDTKVQIGQITFNFVLPAQSKTEGHDSEINVEDVGIVEDKHSDNKDHKPEMGRSSSASLTSTPLPGLGSEKGRGGKLKRRENSNSSATSRFSTPQSVPPAPVPVNTPAHVNVKQEHRDENNLFAQIPADQLAAVNAQVDAAIARLPDIPGFDMPSPNYSSTGSPSGQQSNYRNQLSNLGSSQLQQLQIQNLQNLQAFPGMQPAAGLGLLQQLEALQRGVNPQQAQANQAKTKRRQKREYRPEEIPEQYRNKPALSYSHLITSALRDRLPSIPPGQAAGLSLGDIYEAIMDLFPYYRYCQPGWQNSVRHNLSSSKSFRKVSKEGKGWLWGLDEAYLAEKEKQRQRAIQRQQAQALAQQQAMAEQQARDQAREQERIQQYQREREREIEHHRILAERAARASRQGVPLHQLPIPSPSQPKQDAKNQLPAETVNLLATLQQNVQKELEKSGQQNLSPQLLSNALAVVIAQTAKQAGGLQNLGVVLQQPGAVQKLLTQTLQLLKSTQRVPWSQEQDRTSYNPSVNQPSINPARANQPLAHPPTSLANQQGSIASSLGASPGPAGHGHGLPGQSPTVPPAPASSLNHQPLQRNPIHDQGISGHPSPQNSIHELGNHPQSTAGASPSIGRPAEQGPYKTSDKLQIEQPRSPLAPSTATQRPQESLQMSTPNPQPSHSSVDANHNSDTFAVDKGSHNPSSNMSLETSQPKPAHSESSVHPKPNSDASSKHAAESSNLNANQPDQAKPEDKFTENKSQQSNSLEPSKSASESASAPAPPPGDASATSTSNQPAERTTSEPAAPIQPKPEVGTSQPQSQPQPQTEATNAVKSEDAKPQPQGQPQGQPKRKQPPSLEKICEILAKAEAVPNPSPEIQSMILKLKGHKRQLEAKRKLDHEGATSPPAKRTSV